MAMDAAITKSSCEETPSLNTFFALYAITPPKRRREGRFLFFLVRAGQLRFFFETNDVFVSEFLEPNVMTWFCF